MEVKPFRFSTGVRGALEAAAARLFDPTYQKWAKDSGLMQALQQVKIEFHRRWDLYKQRAGGQDLFDELKAKIEESPGSDHAIGKEYEGREELTPAEEKFLEDNRELVDRFQTYAEKILQEARRRGYAIGDQGARYYPRNVQTLGEAIKSSNEGLQALTPERLRDINFNLEGIRLGQKTFGANSVVAMEKYLRQLADRETIRPFDEFLKREYIPKHGSTEAGQVEAVRRNNLLGERSWLDRTLADKRLEAVKDEQFRQGQKFKSSGRIGAEGDVEVVGESGGRQVGGKDDGEKLYDVTVTRPDGTGYSDRMTRPDLLAMKYADTVLDRHPVTRALWGAHRMASDLYVWANIRSAIHHGISGGAKLVTAGLDSGPLAHGYAEANRWLKGQFTPEEIAQHERVGVLDSDMRGVTESEVDHPGWFRKFGYSGLNGPANYYRVAAYNAFKAQFAGKTWSASKVDAMASLQASAVATIATDAARSPLSFEPLVKALTFMQNAGLKDMTKLVTDAQNGRLGSAAVQAGLTVGTILALHALAGQDVSEMLEAAKHLLPYSSVLTGKGFSFPVTGAVDKGAELVRWVGDITGLRPDEKADLGRALPPWKTLKQLSEGDLFHAMVPAAQRRGQESQ